MQHVSTYISHLRATLRTVIALQDGCVHLRSQMAYSVFGAVCFIHNVTYIYCAISMKIYVRGTYRQTQLFYWLIIVRFTTICFGLIPGPSSGCITT